MRFFVGVTDKSWFKFLAKQNVDEVNFWRPRSRANFRALQPGEPFLFKLHSPDNYIVGGGFFIRHTVVPVSLAWKAFGQKNGVPDVKALTERVIQLGKRTEPDPVIGCTILGEPFFFDQSDWIPIPSDWAPNIVQGKGYDSTSTIGARLWDRVENCLRTLIAGPPSFISNGPRFGSEYLAKARLGQGAFRILVTDAYSRRCAMTGERVLPVLEAAHIQPYAKSGPHRVQNGVLLRSDLHTLFDAGYMTITRDFRVEVSQRIKHEYFNGRAYYNLHGRLLKNLPEDKRERPAPEFIEWHNEHRFSS